MSGLVDLRDYLKHVHVVVRHIGVSLGGSNQAHQGRTEDELHGMVWQQIISHSVRTLVVFAEITLMAICWVI